VVSVVSTEPKVCEFESGQGGGVYKDDKNPQHTFLSDRK
jgi:hypothetical protein